MDALDWIFRNIGALAVFASSAVGFAFFLFKLFAKQWIEAQFKTRLDNLKHQHDIELHRLKVEIDSLLSGSLKLQEKEFVILPALWERLNESHGRAQWFVSPLQQYADVERMAEEELDEFLEAVELRSYEKVKLKESSEKNKLFQDIMFWKNLSVAKAANRELAIYLSLNGIFLPENIRSTCKEIQDSIWGALTSKEIGREAQDRKMEVEGWREIENKVTPLFTVVEAHIRARLLSHAHTQ